MHIVSSIIKFLKRKSIFKNLIPILAVIFIGLVFLYKPSDNLVELKINGKTYKLEVADTKEKRTKGLMFRENLPEDEGMLFIFPTETKSSFWMYNTKIPLDIIWLSKDWEVVYVEKNVPPCESTNPNNCPIYSPGQKAKYVIEINPREY